MNVVEEEAEPIFLIIYFDRVLATEKGKAEAPLQLSLVGIVADGEKVEVVWILNQLLGAVSLRPG